MKTMPIFFFALLIVMLSSCGRKRTPNSCDGVMCTADFRMITVLLKDSTGGNYMPDRVETWNEENVLIHADSMAATPIENSYTIVDDSDLNDLGVNTVHNVAFKIIKNNVVVKQHNYQVKADCCHVIKVSGDNAIAVN